MRRNVYNIYFSVIFKVKSLTRGSSLLSRSSKPSGLGSHRDADALQEALFARLSPVFVARIDRLRVCFPSKSGTVSYMCWQTLSDSFTLCYRANGY